jgi:hypothetical protein
MLFLRQPQLPRELSVLSRHSSNRAAVPLRPALPALQVGVVPVRWTSAVRSGLTR